MIKRILVFFTLFSFCLISQAVVDMKNANFSKTWTDFESAKNPSSFSVIRTYNSRSIFNSLFGFGWCAPFETDLRVTSEGSIRIRECGAGAEYTYYRKNHRPSIYRASNKILKKVQQKNPSLSENQLKKIRSDLMRNSLFKDEMEKRLNLSGKVKANEKYYLSSKSTEFVVFKKGKYFRKLADGSYQVFNSKGFLTRSIDSKQKKQFHFFRNENGKIKKVLDEKSNQFVFSYLKGKKNFVISGPENMKSSYLFDGEKLKCVIDHKKQKTCYSYDSLQNMTRIVYPDQSEEKLTYDLNKDWVTSFTHKNKCVERYQYGQDAKNPLNHYWSDVVKSCKGKVVHKAHYAFKFKKNKSGERYLHQVRFKKNKEDVKVKYHPLYSRPVVVEKNGKKTVYNYKKGRVHQRLVGNQLYQYTYENQCNKVRKLKISSYLKDRKLASPKKASLVYNFKYKTCQLSKCSNSLGKKLDIFQKRGLLTYVINESKQKMKFSYYSKSKKISSIQVPSVGYIRFSYDSQGRRSISDKSSVQALYKIVQMLQEVFDMIKLSDVSVDV